MKMIVAANTNNVIGINNKLPFHCKEDLKWFKFMTMGTSCLVGRVTYETLPNLPGRRLIVMSSKNIEGVTCINETIFNNEMLTYNGKFLPEWVIGGQKVYEFCLNKGIISEVYVSRINNNKDGDTYLPDLTKYKIRKLSEMELSNVCTIERWGK